MITTITKRTYTDYEIFRFYCGDFQLEIKILSPLRSESNPSFTIFNTEKGLRFRDFGTGIAGNAVELVKQIFGLNTYKAAMHKIEMDLSGTSSFLGLSLPPIIKPKVETIIKIRAKDWSKEDLEYWENYGISLDLLKQYQVFPISHYWINNHLFNCKFGFAYYFGKVGGIDRFKLYFPLEIKGNKWYSNCGSIIQGEKQLITNSEILIITSSLKDILCLSSFGFSSLAAHSETTFIAQSKLEEYKMRFKTIIIWLNNDQCGIEASLYYQKLGFKTIFTEGLTKDPSDYYKLNGRTKTQQLINNLIYDKQ